MTGKLTGPRRGEVFVTSSFAKQVAEIEAGLRGPTIFVGDLKPRRDFSDNLCSARSWAIQQLLDLLLEQSSSKGITRQD